MRIPTYIMVHSSATEDGATVSWAAIEKYHREDANHLWRDIGYHGGVEEVTGNPELAAYKYQALLGRGSFDVAAACPQGAMNEIALHICFIGEFDSKPPPREQLLVGVKRLILPWRRQFAIPVEQIVAHHEYNPMKTCPGKMFNMTLFKEMCR